MSWKDEFRRGVQHVGTLRAIAIVSAFTVLALAPGRISAQDRGALRGQTTQTPAPQAYVPQLSSIFPAPTAAQVAASEAQMKINQGRWARRTLPLASATVVGPAPGSESLPNAGPSPEAPGTATVFLSSNLSPLTGSSNINEPSIAQAGKNVFYTGNWYAARSIDSGATWSYINPYGDFDDFCCDQDVVYDKSRNIMLWYRQGVTPPGGTGNVFKLGVSTDGGESFCTYTIAPTNVDGTLVNREFDFPHIALSNRYLYITTNVFTTTDAFDRMLLLRWPLDALAGCAAFSYTYWSSTTGWTWSPVEGATTQMYLGDHVDTSTLRVYRQPESSTTLFWVDRAIDAWTFTNRNGNCPVLGGANPCARADQRILSGWVRSLGDGQEGNRQIGFFWNVKEGGNFPHPYVNAATFRETDQVYTGRPAIWNSNVAFHYPAAAPNHRGDLGIGLFVFAPGSNPSYIIGVDDDYNGAPAPWELYTVRNSSTGPADNTWGDFVRVRMLDPVGVGWAATGYFRKFNGVKARTKPYFVIFGRERDTNGILRSMNAP